MRLKAAFLFITLTLPAQAADILFIDPATSEKLIINPKHLDENGRATVLFLAQCDRHLTPFMLENLSDEIMKKALLLEEEVKRDIFLAVQKYKPKEQEKIISTLCVAIASGRYDRKKLTELVTLDFQKGGQFMDVLSAMVVTPHSTEKQIVAKIMAHEESHYTPEQLPLFHAEVKRVYTESKLTLER